MFIKILFLLFALKTARCSGSDEELVDYYDQLIKDSIAATQSYQFPKDASAYRPTNAEPEDFGIFDFVVIGSGSAGSVVASRLSEINDWTVLLLEAGKEGNNFTDIPAMSMYTSSSEYNWGFNCTPEPTCCQAFGGVCPYPRGKALGGTSVINSLVYARGNKLDYNRWEAQGNPGWSYQDVLPYFIKSENSKLNDGDPGYHGVGGYIDVEYHYPTSKRVDVFLEGNQELGYPPTDVNGENQLGASRNQFTTRNGRRLSSAKAFLTPARNRTNLKILTAGYVTRILLNDNSNKAYGVLFSYRNVEYLVRVNKEVVLSAGVVGSPQILMQSGIGPADQLQQLGIPVRKDLGVGQRMQDHLVFYNMYFITPKPERSITMREAIRQYLKGIGPLTISTNPQGVAFYVGTTNAGLPEFEVVLVPVTNPSGVPGIQSGLLQNFPDVNIPNLKDTIIGNHVFQISIVLLHPKSTGKIELTANDPYQYPKITCGCLADPNNEDIESVYRGIQEISKLMNTDAFRRMAAVITPYSSCMSHGLFSKAYWLCVIRQTAMNAYHSVGTCRMGPDPSKGDVVDNRLRVHGVPNIRIADTSVIPTTVSGHTSMPAVMIGERLPDFIKEEYGRI